MRMHIQSQWLIFAVLALLLSGCQTNPASNQQQYSNEVLDAVTVQVKHGLVEGRIGQSMDKRDYRRLKSALGRKPHKVAWKNKTTRIRYYLSMRKPRYQGKTTCRIYSIQAKVDGFRQSTRGRACKKRKGQWVASYIPGHIAKKKKKTRRYKKRKNRRRKSR